jgi:hypothetical protein
MMSECDWEIPYASSIQEPIKLADGRCFNITASIASGYILTIQELPCTPKGKTELLTHKINNQHLTSYSSSAVITNAKLWKKAPTSNLIYYFKVTNTTFDEKDEDDDYDQEEEVQEPQPDDYCEVELMKFEFDSDN